ncbi:PQ loop repeat-domain-containing protein [Lineolata rhizophorae]|uniref:PQ loop repeat-domain-containing protein n=1 Tax=Lineolata rhizophorae TaxID=578093 RepID=A0A6A6NV82_9PEZI|nr:PQ loop repeat-domain-containing protein [Lineolata rhizophorae]
MYPPSQGLDLDVEAVSGILGSISIACWIVVFSPQIIENFRRSSADGLSVVFIVVWLAGDVFNILGAVLQGVLPTMIILAVYYTFADIVLLLQCFYYKGFTLSDHVPSKPEDEESESSSEDENSPLLQGGRHRNGNANGTTNDASRQGSPHIQHRHHHHDHPPRISDAERRQSSGSLRERLMALDGTHLSPATPFIPDAPPQASVTDRILPSSTTSKLKSVTINFGSLLLVCAAGVFGWWLSYHPSSSNSEDGGEDSDTLKFNIAGQVFGYICAVLYLGSRIPQLLLNYRRKSTEGVSMLFFLFACVGNLTYVLSIFAYEPICVGGERGRSRCQPGEAGAIYARYIAVNFSWLLGSFGTLLLDAAVFVQYFMYKKDQDEDETSEEEYVPG